MNKKISRASQPTLINKKKRTKKRKVKPVVILTVMMTLCLIVGGILVFNLARHMLVNVIAVNSSSLEEVRTDEFTVLRTEVILVASHSGILDMLAEEGEKVPKDTTVAYLIKEAGSSLQGREKVALRTPCSGVLSYVTDGYEGLCQPSGWENLDLESIKATALKAKPQTVTKSKAQKPVTAGEVIAKITDNLSPTFLVADSQLPWPANWTKGTFVELTLEGLQNSHVTAVVSDKRENEERNRLLLRIPSVLGIQGFRKVEAKLVLNRQVGFVVHENLLVERNGERGVFLLQRGVVVWRAVKVGETVQGKVVLQGLKQGELVIALPRLVKEGQRIIPLRQ